MFTTTDLKDLVNRKITPDRIRQQLETFKKGFPFIHLARPATIEDGIRSLSEHEAEELAAFFDQQASGKEIVKFVPASGAATRMFKDLFEWLAKLRQGEQNNQSFPAQKFIEGLPSFAFYPLLADTIALKGKDIHEIIYKKEFEVLLAAFLEPKGMNYGNLPKGLLLFHKTGKTARTPFEEHLIEACNYGKGTENRCRLHFTVSPEYESAFRQHFNQVRRKYEEQYHVIFDVGLSVQNPSTDTLAVDHDNNPFRDAEGKLVFRPAGHGALLENLQSVNADLIFIKNIDNVVSDQLKQINFFWKKVLAGLLIKIKNQVSAYIRTLQSEVEPTDSQLDEILDFIKREFNISLPACCNREEQIEQMSDRLNRPLRICGMVRNEKEPGGGPFWVKQEEGTETLQIVEPPQINTKEPDQLDILNHATHFNPVDIVCSTRDSKGQTYDLHQYIDPATGFISVKSKDGLELKALELPGLWNGSMAWWNTIFVEVPIETFNPVKTVNDLLRESHQ